MGQTDPLLEIEGLVIADLGTRANIGLARLSNDLIRFGDVGADTLWEIGVKL